MCGLSKYQTANVSALPNPISRLAFDGSESTLRVKLAALLEEVLDTFV